MPKAVDKTPKLTYPPGCKELGEELSKDELVKRLKVSVLNIALVKYRLSIDIIHLRNYYNSLFNIDVFVLQTLARTFQDMGQEEDNNYKELAVFLSSELFLEHPSKDVRLLVACCIADIFRIFAPEAPYTDARQLKEIFLFLTQQLRGLGNPESPSFKRYFYLLEVRNVAFRYIDTVYQSVICAFTSLQVSFTLGQFCFRTYPGSNRSTFAWSWTTVQRSSLNFTS